MINRTSRMRKLHAQLRDLGIPREEFKKRIGCQSMCDLSDKELGSKIGYLNWVAKQPYPARRAHGASR